MKYKIQTDDVTKHCIDCNSELIVGNNWTETMKKHSKYMCKNCYATKKRKWLDGKPNYDNHKWDRQHPEESKACHRKAISKWKKNNPEKVKKYIAKRNRNIGWELLFDNPFPDNIPVDYHHISDGFVVAIPRSLHRRHCHGKNKQLHRDELKPFIESIYNISYIIN